MALQLLTSIKGRDFNEGYHRIDSLKIYREIVGGTGEPNLPYLYSFRLAITVCVYFDKLAANDVAHAVDVHEFNFIFDPQLRDNPMKQGYNFLKTLAEYAGAIDV